MPRRPAVRASDLRGAARLATDATAGLADLVEALHERIARVPGFSATPDGRTTGLTGLIYQSIRGVTRVVGGSVDGLLQLLAPVLTAPPGSGPAEVSSPEREALLAALNGVLGDYLVASGNPLAIPMRLRHAGRALPAEAPALKAALPSATGRLLVLMHGLCMNDGQWLRQGQDLGQHLAAAAGYTPVHVHYNTGQHISLNGRALARQLDLLLQAWPQPVTRLVLMGHSMGGLLARSAVAQGRQAGLGWASRVDDLVCLGSPHHGAPLERAGNWIDLLLGAAPYASPFARLGQLRSAGITDLRHGNLQDEDWVGRDRFARGPDRRLHLPLPDGVRCFALAGLLGEAQGQLSGRLLGDGLVPLDSALGRHADPARCLGFEAQRQWVGQGLGHLDLLSSPAVAGVLSDWLA